MGKKKSGAEEKRRKRAKQVAKEVHDLVRSFEMGPQQQQQQQQQHGHSHGGKPCHGHGHAAPPPPPQQHGHSHGGKPCHGHGHSHGQQQQQQQQQHQHQHQIQPRDPVREVRQLKPLLAQLVSAQRDSSTVLATAPADEADMERRLERFRAWMRERAPGSGLGEKWDVRAGVSEGGGAGVVATAGVAAGEAYMRVPRALMITRETVEADPLVGELSRGSTLLQRMPWVAVALFLALQFRRGDESPWAPYLAVLPREFDLPMFFDGEGELEALAGSNAYADALRQTVNVASQHALVSGMLRAVPGAPAVTYDDWRRSVALVMSRQNPLDGSVALMPGFDFSNHADFGEDSRVTAHFDVAAAELEVCAPRAAAAGEQLYIYYGPRPNRQLLLYQGFVAEPHSRDAAYLSVRRTLQGAAPELRVQALLLAKRGFRPHGETFTVTAAEPVTRRMLDFLRLSCVTKDEAAFAFKNPDAERLGDRNERAALELGLEFGRRALEGYPGAGAGVDSRRGRLAAALHAAEKRLLGMYCAEVERLLGGLAC